ncbi:MAG: DUF4175 family protein, partial [Balneolaceae bacterium]
AELNAEISFTGPEPSELFFALKTDIEDEFRLRPMRKIGAESAYLAQPVEMTSDAEYKIIMDEFESQRFRVEVQQRPRFDSLIVQIQPPSYTGLSGEIQYYPFSRIQAYKGAEIQLEAYSNKPVESARILLHDNEDDLQAAGENFNHFEYSFVVSKTDTIRFNLMDSDHLSNRNPFRFTIDIREDEYPSAVIREPEFNLSIIEPDQLNIIYQATDDFGLTKATLEWELRRAFVQDPIKGNIALKTPSIGRHELIIWDLKPLNLRPRDEVEFWIRVWDNDEINGYKTGTSQHIILSVPSMTAYFDEIDSRERDVQDRLENVSEAYKNMQREYQNFLEQLKQKETQGWEEQQQLEELQESQKKIEETVKELSSQFEELRRELEQSDFLSE